MLVGLRAAVRAYGRGKIDDEGPQIGSRRAQDYGGQQGFLVSGSSVRGGGGCGGR